MKASRWVDDVLFTPAAPTGIIAARVILAVQALWILISQPYLPTLASWPDVIWSMPSVMRLRFGIFRFDGVATFEIAAWVVLHVALIAVLFGIATRVSCLAAAALLYHFAPFEDLVSGLLYMAGIGGLTLPVLGFVILAFAPAPARDDEWSPDYRWPLVLIEIIFAFNYLSAGLAKLHWAGLKWYSTTNFGRMAGLMSTFQSPRLATYVYEHPAVATILGIATFLLEFLFPLVIFSKWARRIILPIAVVALILRIHVLGFFFVGFPALLLFVNWDWVDARLRKGVRDEETKPEVEANLLASQGAMSPSERDRAQNVVRKLDWRRTVEYAQLHGTTQFLAEMLHKLDIRPEGEPARVLALLVQRNSARSLIQYRETRRILAAFGSRGIRAIPYKGTILSSQLFGRANARISGDIDVLIEQSDFHAAAATLDELGYHRSGYQVADEVFLERWKDETFSNQQTRCNVELQWRAMPTDASCDFITDTPRLKSKPLNGDPGIAVLADDDLFLTLAHHGLTHRWESLKWVADIDAFCRRQDVDWSAVAARARETGSFNIAALAVHVAARLLHTPIPDAFQNISGRVRRTCIRLTNAIRTETQIGDLQSFVLQFFLRERWRDRVRFVRFVCTPKPRDVAEGKFLGLPNFIQPLLRPLRLMFESHSGHKRALSDVQKVVEWDA